MEATKLARALLRRKLVGSAVIEQAVGALRPRETLADRLVADGVISEIDVLRVIAQETSTRFVSSHRLTGLQVAKETLDCIPLAVAEEHDVLPVIWDKKSKALVLVMADPSKVGALERLPALGRADHLTVNVALRTTVRAAIERLYAGKATTRSLPRVAGECPQCGQPYLATQLECARCGLLLNPDAPVDHTDSRIVRALLRNPTGEHALPEGDVFGGPTRLGLTVQVDDGSVPEVIAGVDVAGSLAELEALLVSLVDGKTSVGELAQGAGLAAVEGRSIIASLVERNVLRLATSVGALDVDTDPGHGDAAQPPPPTAPAAPPADGLAAETVVVPPEARGGPPSGSPSVVVSTGVYAPLPTKTSPSAPPPAALEGPVPAPPGKTRRVAPPRHAAPTLAGMSAADPEEPTEGAGFPGLPAEQLERERLRAANPAGTPAAPPLEVPRHLQPEVQMQNSLQHALALERRGQVTGAISVLKVAISRSAAAAPLYNRLALVLLNQRRDAAQAEQLLHKAIKLDPDNPVYQENLAKVLMHAAARPRGKKGRR